MNDDSEVQQGRMVTVVEELYTDDLHLIKITGDTEDTDYPFKVIVMQRVIAWNGDGYDWEPVASVACAEWETLADLRQAMVRTFSAFK